MSTISPSAQTANGTDLAAAFETHLASQQFAPAWWRERKQQAFADYQRLPMPTRRDEQWRFASLSGLDVNAFDFTIAASAEEAAALADRSHVVTNHAGRMVFADNQLVAVDPVAEELARLGVVWMPLIEALDKHGDILQEYFMAQDPHLGSEKFAALHSAFATAGSLLYVPPGVEIKQPLVAFHWSATDRAAVFPHSLVIAGDHAHVTLIDVFSSRDDSQRNLACGFAHHFCGDGARLEHYGLQNWSEHSLGFQINSLIAGRDANIRSLAVNLGCRHFRSETHSIIKGEGADVAMTALSLTDRNQEMDQRTLQTHRAGNSRSDLLFKNALMDDSRTIFSGLIQVAEEAQKTDAYQTNRNLLLSGTAEANSLPGLEIEANDVKCSHGATTGQIDESELFYMLSRGINRRRARELFVFGFFEEVIGRITNEELAGGIRELIQRKFHEDEARHAVETVRS